MDKKMLQDYNEWLKRTPQEIIQAVKDEGGWAKVFSDGLPLWAHKVRNFFNHEPQFLTRLGTARSVALIGKLHVKIHEYGGVKDHIARFGGLSGDVYTDNYGKIWYQMSPGGTIYHFKKKVKNEMTEAYYQTVAGQINTPVFKLISPDGTGGSHETIIDNPILTSTIGQMANRYLDVSGSPIKVGRTNIGQVDASEGVAHRINKDYAFQGSYNFAETVKVGIELHDKYDIQPHKKNTDYKNPPTDERFLPLGFRSFPKTDTFGKTLADQK